MCAIMSLALRRSEIIIYILDIRISTYTHHASRQIYIYWKNSTNNHVILKGVDVEMMKVIQLASEVHN